MPPAPQETDESSIPLFTIANHTAPPSRASESIRYPFAGGNNAVLRIGVLAAQGGTEPPLWLDLGIDWVRRKMPAPTSEDEAGADWVPRPPGPTCEMAGPTGRGMPSEAEHAKFAAAGPRRRLEPSEGEYGSSGYKRFADGCTRAARPSLLHALSEKEVGLDRRDCPWEGCTRRPLYRAHSIIRLPTPPARRARVGCAPPDLVSVCFGRENSLFVQVQNRSQRALRLLRFAPPGSEGGWRAANAGAPPLLGTIVLEERSPCWVSLHTCFRELNDGALVWASARTGFQHLYLFSAAGKCEGALTAGQWVVDSVEAVDEATNLIHFSGSLGDSAQRNLFSAPLRAAAAPAAPRAAAPPPSSSAGARHKQGGRHADEPPPPPQAPTRLTREDGWHVVEVSHGRRLFVDTFSAIGTPFQVTLRRLSDGQGLVRLFESCDPRLSRLRLPSPEVLRLRNQQGDELRAVVCACLQLSACSRWFSFAPLARAARPARAAGAG